VSVSSVKISAVGATPYIQALSAFMALLFKYIMRIWYGSGTYLFRILSLGTRWKRMVIFTLRLVSCGERTLDFE
jgi:hypothetical protein